MNELSKIQYCKGRIGKTHCKHIFEEIQNWLKFNHTLGPKKVCKAWKNIKSKRENCKFNYILCNISFLSKFMNRLSLQAC
jgi:hypothetical protein